MPVLLAAERICLIWRVSHTKSIKPQSVAPSKLALPVTKESLREPNIRLGCEAVHRTRAAGVLQQELVQKTGVPREARVPQGRGSQSQEMPAGEKEPWKEQGGDPS